MKKINPELPATLGEDDDAASSLVTTMFQGMVFKSAVVCQGDGDHGPHVEVAFVGGQTLHVLWSQRALLVGMSMEQSDPEAQLSMGTNIMSTEMH